MALQKLSLSNNISCGKCNRAIPTLECKVEETTHNALNLKTEEKESHYKLQFICPRCNDIIAAAVVWNYEVVA